MRWKGLTASNSYNDTSGADVPTVRSCIAALLVLAALSLGREAITLRLIATGALLVLLALPESLAGPSFQLSFAAVTAIVALHETGRDEDAVYLVSELVVGSTLAELMAEGALSDKDVLQIGAALCDALAHAHSRGVVHRDVKPQNIIVPDTQQDGIGVAKLTDFGIAMLLDEDVLTRTGDVVGTLNLYGHAEDTFVGKHQELADALSAWAPGAVTNADLAFSTLEAARRAPEQLRHEALVDTATGFLAAELDVDIDEARRRLDDAATRAGISVSALAQAMMRLYYDE